MQDFLYHLGKMLYPELPDEELMDNLDELRAAHPDQDDEILALALVQDYMEEGE